MSPSASVLVKSIFLVLFLSLSCGEVIIGIVGGELESSTKEIIEIGDSKVTKSSITINNFQRTNVQYNIDENYPIELYNDSCFKTLIANKTKIIESIALSINDLIKLNSNKLPYDDKGSISDLEYTKENIFCHNKIVGTYKWGFNSSTVVVGNVSIGVFNNTFHNSSDDTVRVNITLGNGTYISEVFNINGSFNHTNLTANTFSWSGYEVEASVREFLLLDDSVVGLWMEKAEGTAWKNYGSGGSVIDFPTDSSLGTTIFWNDSITYNGTYGTTGSYGFFNPNPGFKLNDPDVSPLDFKQNFTFCFWHLNTAAGDIINSGGTTTGFRLECNGNWFFRIGGLSDEAWTNQIDGSSCSDGNWHFTCLVYNSTHFAGYKDGTFTSGDATTGDMGDFNGTRHFGLFQDGQIAMFIAINETKDKIWMDEVYNFTRMTWQPYKEFQTLSNGVDEVNWSIDDTANFAQFKFKMFANSTDSTIINNFNATFNNLSLAGEVTDTTAPTVTLIAPLNRSNISSNSIDFNYSATDDTAVTNCTLFINNIVNRSFLNNNNFTSTAIGNGNHSWFVNCTDAVPNVGFSGIFNLTVNASVVVDITPPTFTNNQNNASNTRINGVVNFSIDVADETALKNITFYWNDTGSWLEVASSKLSGTSEFYNTTQTVTAIRDNFICGNYSIRDSSDNENKTNLSCFTVANSPPTIPIITSPHDNERNNTRKIDFTSTDADGDTITYNIYINNTLNITTTINVTVWNGSDGAYNLTITATDGIDTSANSSVINFILDTTPPVVNILFPTNFLNISSNSIDLNATATDNFNSSSMTFYWVINGTINSTTIGSNSTFNASDGFYNLTLFVSDDLQNGSDEVLFTLDTISPPINNLRNESTSTTTSNINWNSTENHNYSLLIYNSTILVFNANVDTFAIGYSVSATGLTINDTHIVNLTICDNSGNCKTNNTFNFTTSTTDTSPPTFTGNQNNATGITPAQNGDIQINITIEDGIGLSHYWFAWNDSGNFVNITNGTLSGTSNKIILNNTVTAINGSTIGYRWQSNDTSNNLGISPIFTFGVFIPTVPKRRHFFDIRHFETDFGIQDEYCFVFPQGNKCFNFSGFI